MLINVVSTTIAAATSSSYPNCTANTEDIDAQGHASRIITTSATIPLILNILKIDGATPKQTERSNYDYIPSLEQKERWENMISKSI